ncbi:hypothetical protein [Nocardia australiensis]|uniref:hypothetical protein n=1 Tax=Nocardia australiensis TaxID=2887191 RepID=UPI001D134DD8|nr:hypothetical protein [Nocardia australiensis]
MISTFAAIGALAWVVAERQRGIVAIGSGLLAVQVVLHLRFGVASVSGGHGSSHAVAHESAGTYAGPVPTIAVHSAVVFYRVTVPLRSVLLQRVRHRSLDGWCGRPPGPYL